MIDYQAILDDPSDLLNSYENSSFISIFPVSTAALITVQSYVRKRVVSLMDIYSNEEIQDAYEIEMAKASVLFPIMQEHIKLVRLDSLL